MGFKLFFELSIDQEFKNAFLNDKETVAKASGLKDKSVFIDVTVEHFFFDILEFAFRKVVENEMVFETVYNEVGVVQGFLFGDKLNILGDSVLNGFNLFGFIVSEEFSL